MLGRVLSLADASLRVLNKLLGLERHGTADDASTPPARGLAGRDEGACLLVVRCGGRREVLGVRTLAHEEALSERLDGGRHGRRYVGRR